MCKLTFGFSINISVNTPPKKSCHVLSSLGTANVAKCSKAFIQCEFLSIVPFHDGRILWFL